MGEHITEAPPAGRCLDCDYLLQGLDTRRCPECGRAFDPDDPATMSGERRMTYGQQFFNRPPGWPLGGQAGVVMGVLLYAQSVPGDYFLWMSFGAYAFLAVLIAWGYRLVLACFIKWRWGLPFRAFVDEWRRWALVPAVLLLTVFVSAIELTLTVRFALSHAAMNRFAQQALLTPPGTPPPSPGSVGLFPATQIETFPGGVRFLVPGADFIDSSGFAYSPHHPPPVIGENRYRPWTDDGWYIWQQRF